MVHGAHCSVGGNVNFNDIEAKRTRRFPKTAHVSVGCTAQSSLLACIDSVNGSAEIVFRPRFHFDKHQRIAFPCDDVYLVTPETKITTQNSHSGFPLQKRSGKFFAGIPYSSTRSLFCGMRENAFPNSAKPGNELAEK